MSAFKIETWLKKGYTEEEAKYQIAIRRPTNILYWMVNYDLNEEEALIKKLEHQKKGGKGSANRPIEKIRETSPRCKEYWISKGYSEEDAIIKVSETQATFSLNICIEKYGEEEGYCVWKSRQDCWQETLKAKSDEEIEEINKKKDCKKISSWINKYGDKEGKEKFIEYLIKNTGKPPPQKLDDIKQYILAKIDPIDVYLPIDRIRNIVPRYFWELVKRPKDFDGWLKSFIDFKAPYGEIIFKKINPNAPQGLYQMHVGKKLLRSSREILFYNILKEHDLHLDIDFEIERYYDNSKMRSDFYLSKGNIYIEILGRNTSKDMIYEQKMLYKQATFGSVLMRDPKEYEEYIKTYKEQYYNDR